MLTNTNNKEITREIKDSVYGNRNNLFKIFNEMKKYLIKYNEQNNAFNNANLFRYNIHDHFLVGRIINDKKMQDYISNKFHLGSDKTKIMFAMFDETAGLIDSFSVSKITDYVYKEINTFK